MPSNAPASSLMEKDFNAIQLVRCRRTTKLLSVDYDTIKYEGQILSHTKDRLMTTLINGVELKTVEQGNGETILFVHGSNNDYRTWIPQQEAFSDTFRTISYSRRYHYPNDTIPETADYSMAEQLDDLDAYIKSLDVDKVHLVGHSYGAFLGLLLAIRDSSAIQSLTLIEPPIFTLFISIPPKPQEILGLLLTRPRTAIAIIRFAVTGLNPAVKAAEDDDMEQALQVFGRAVLGENTFNNLSAERLEQARANNFKSELLGSGFLPLDEADIQRVHLPTLLINGADSPALFHRFNDRLLELLPNSTQISIPQASHVVHQDNVLAFNTQLRAFFEKHSVS